MASDKKFNLSDNVQWRSTSAGSTLRKVGQVVEIIPSGCTFDPRKMCAKHGAGGALGYGGSRDHESYIVLVGRTETRKGTLYWPRVSHLAKA